MGIDSSGQVDLYFGFVWQNPTEYLAVLKAESDLVLKGTGDAEAQSTFFFGGHAYADPHAELVLSTLSGGFPFHGAKTDIPTVYAHADSGLGGVPVKSHRDFSGIYHVTFDSQLEVDAFDWAFFIVHFWAVYDVHHGKVTLDFSSSNNSIMCPSVQMDFLTPPPVIAP